MNARKRWTIAGFAVVFIACAATIAARHRTPNTADIVEAEGLLIGSEARVKFPVHNPNLISEADLTGITCSCGCARVITQPTRIAARSVGEIEVGLRPNGHDLRGNVQVSYMLGTSRKSTIISYKVVPPLDGWPREASVDTSKGQMTVQVNPAYTGSTYRFVLLGPGKNRSELSPTGDRLVLPSHGTPWLDSDLAIESIVDGAVVWAGPIVLMIPIRENT